MMSEPLLKTETLRYSVSSTGSLTFPHRPAQRRERSVSLRFQYPASSLLLARGPEENQGEPNGHCRSADTPAQSHASGLGQLSPVCGEQRNLQVCGRASLERALALGPTATPRQRPCLDAGEVLAVSSSERKIRGRLGSAHGGCGSWDQGGNGGGSLLSRRGKSGDCRLGACRRARSLSSSASARDQSGNPPSSAGPSGGVAAALRPTQPRPAG